MSSNVKHIVVTCYVVAVNKTRWISTIRKFKTN